MNIYDMVHTWIQTKKVDNCKNTIQIIIIEFFNHIF